MSHTLVATLGTTPQVLTEAFYYHHRHLGITFDEVHVLTTSTGARALRDHVLGANGIFAALCRDLGLPRRSVKFGPSTVHIMLGAGGTPVEDVRTTADGEAVANQMLAVIRQVCRDPHRTVHAIVSGGRKVMSIYMHAMMQLVGRPQDSLFHILVHPALETQILDGRRLDFFYPKGPLRIAGRSIPARDLLSYIEVPLLCVSPRESLKRELPYAQLVHQRRQELECLMNPPGLVLDPRRHQLVIADHVVRLPPNEFFWYAAMARLVMDGRGRLPVPELLQSLRIDGRGTIELEAEPDDQPRLDDIIRRLRAYHRELFPSSADTFPQTLKAACGAAPPGLASTAAKINKRLRAALHGASTPYEVRGGRGAGGYGLTLPPEKLQFLPTGRQ